jgi:hypothetical protein
VLGVVGGWGGGGGGVVGGGWGLEVRVELFGPVGSAALAYCG